MKSEWHYSRDGKDSGPVSSAELRQLAATGKLLRTDLLWKEGMAEWKPAAQFPKLFPDEKPASAMIADEAGEDPLASFKLDVDPSDKKSAKAEAPASVAGNLASLQVDVAAAGRKATSKVKSHARTAGKFAVLAGERAKISTVTLPIAYAELGEHCYRSRTYAEEFGELFTKLDAVQAGIAESGKPAEAGGDTIAEKAKAWAEQGMKFAQSQAQGVQAKALFVQLGKACFNRFGPEAGPEELVTRTQALRDRLSELDAEVKTGVNKTVDFTLLPRAANAARRGMQSLKARPKGVRPHAQAGCPRVSSPKRILLIPGDFWAWLLPWVVLLGSILATLAIAFGIAATFFPQAMIRNIGLPADVVRAVRIAPSFSLSFAFWFAVNALLLVTMAISGLVAFPLLRERSAQGWRIVFWQVVASWGCCACWAIITLVSSPLVFVVLLLLSSPLWLICALGSYIVWRLRSRFGIPA